MCDSASIQQFVLCRNRHHSLSDDTSISFVIHVDRNHHVFFISRSDLFFFLADSSKNLNLPIFIPALILTGTFFCVTTTAESLPLTATDVKPPWLIALNAYSATTKRIYELMVLSVPWKKVCSKTPVKQLLFSSDHPVVYQTNMISHCSETVGVNDFTLWSKLLSLVSSPLIQPYPSPPYSSIPPC